MLTVDDGEVLLHSCLQLHLMLVWASDKSIKYIHKLDTFVHQQGQIQDHISTDLKEFFNLMLPQGLFFDYMTSSNSLQLITELCELWPESEGTLKNFITKMENPHGVQEICPSLQKRKSIF